jgi:hypothetical protein
VDCGENVPGVEAGWIVVNVNNLSDEGEIVDLVRKFCPQAVVLRITG